MIFLFSIIVISPFGAYNLVYLKKVYPGISCLGSTLGGLGKTEATTTIEKVINDNRLYQKNLLLLKNDNIWKITSQDLNLKYDASKTAEKTLLVGRRGNIFIRSKEKFTALKKGWDFSPQYSLDEKLLAEKVASIAAKIYVAPINPTIALLPWAKENEERIKVDPGRPGENLNQEQLITEIKSRYASSNFSPLEIYPEINPISLTSEEINAVKATALKILGKRIKLVLGNKHWLIEEANLVNFINLKGQFDKEKIFNYLEKITPSIDYPPKNASFQFDKGRVITFSAARQGQSLDKEKTTIDILALLQQPSSLEEQSLKLTVKPISPEITTANSNSLGIVEPLGKGQSWFDGSISSRSHNIKLAASKFHGQLLAPGEILSFNDKIGEINEANGYKKAYIIKNGRTVLGDGGGVCQVSTTLFRAALHAGLPIIERYPHAYRVSYYEQKSQPGFDATVFSPSVDFKFKNDTRSYLLIQAKTDLIHKSLTINFYGTSDNRQVVLSKSKIWDQIPPPPTLYQEDSSLPPGTIKQIDWAAWGAKVSFSWQVIRDGQTLHKKTFYSNYRPWQAIYLTGKKQ